jgi:hypothetical protein
MNTNETIVAGLAIFLGLMVVLIPITGLTLRFALKPMMEALGKYREVQGDKQMQALLERRVSLMEEQLHSMDRSLRELAEESEFRRELESGRTRPAALPLPTHEAQPQAVQHADPLSRSA